MDRYIDVAACESWNVSVAVCAVGLLLRWAGCGPRDVGSCSSRQGAEADAEAEAGPWIPVLLGRCVGHLPTSRGLLCLLLLSGASALVGTPTSADLMITLAVDPVQYPTVNRDWRWSSSVNACSCQLSAL